MRTIFAGQFWLLQQLFQCRLLVGVIASLSSSGGDNRGIGSRLFRRRWRRSRRYFAPVGARIRQRGLSRALQTWSSLLRTARVLADWRRGRTSLDLLRDHRRSCRFSVGARGRRRRFGRVSRKFGRADTGGLGLLARMSFFLRPGTIVRVSGL